MGDPGLTKSRRRVQEAVEQAEAERKRQLFIKRIELAENGLKAFRSNKPIEAVRAFHTYLRILEEWKNVGEGGLNPSLFDPKKDAAELLLVSGVYWALVKVYDRTKSAEKHREFMHYLEKFILFSKGMRFQNVSAESIRKYMAVERARHVDELKHAYKVLATSKCFIVTELVDEVGPETLSRLRCFREDVLKKSGPGRDFVAWYYRKGPGIAERLSRWPRLPRKTVARSLDFAGWVWLRLSAKPFRSGSV